MNGPAVYSKMSTSLLIVFLHAADLQELDTPDRIMLIQDHMKALQQKYMELKTEVSYLDKKRRRARRKEREGAKRTVTSA